jgi:hypothetical protein
VLIVFRSISISNNPVSNSGMSTLTHHDAGQTKFAFLLALQVHHRKEAAILDHP